MATDLVPLTAASLTNDPRMTLSLPAWLERSLTVMRTEGKTAILPHGAGLTTEHYLAVQERVRALGAALMPTPWKSKAAAVTSLLLAFPAQAMSEAAAQIRAKAFEDALADLPGWSVERARLKWLRGEVGDMNPAFAPSPPQLRALALEAMQPAAAQRYRLTRLLAAAEDGPPLSAEELARRADLVEQWTRSASRTTEAKEAN